jgi:hypothetical protein
MGYINYKPEYEEIASRWPGKPRDRIVEISGKVLRICARGTLRFPEVEYRRYREANP